MCIEALIFRWSQIDICLHVSTEDLFHSATKLRERLDGEVILRESPHDPVVDVPVRELIGITYSEGDTYTHGEILTRIPRESFLPYMFGKADDLKLLAEAAQSAPV